MGFIIIIIIIIVGVVGFIALKISEARQNRLKKKIEEIRGQYPLAYKEFVSKNHISVSDAKNSTLATIVERSAYSWNEDEKRLQEQERKRIETEIQYKEIEKQYPEGLKKWKRQNPYATKENTVLNRNKIKDFEKAVKKAFEFDDWEREQKEFTKKCRDLVDELLPNFGCYPYEVPFRKTNEDGKNIDGKYLVWQSFAGSYCLESDLDYAGFENIKRNTSNLNEFKSRKRHYLPPVYEKIQKYIEKLCEEYSVSIYLCANNQDWSAESLNFHYNMCDGTPFYGFPDNVEVCDPASDAWFEGNDLDYDNYPRLKNRHIIIVEMQTDNDHLKTVCKSIIEKNKDIHPLITYISLLKSYDREEMLKLIYEEKQKHKEEEDRKQKEKEEEEKRKAELEKYKPDKEAINNLLRNNGINCFYHFTARRNLESIRRLGGLYSWFNMEANGNKIPCSGGDDLSHQLDKRYGLEDFVRLSFCNDHPMAYRLQQNGVTLVLLKIDVEVATWKETQFSDINAADSNHSRGGTLADLRKVDFDAVKRNFVSRNDVDFKPHQAEVMVKTFIPAKYIINLNSPLPL